MIHAVLLHRAGKRRFFVLLFKKNLKSGKVHNVSFLVFKLKINNFLSQKTELKLFFELI